MNGNKSKIKDTHQRKISVPPTIINVTSIRYNFSRNYVIVTYTYIILDLIYCVRYLYDLRRLISPNRIYEKSMNPRDVDC